MKLICEPTLLTAEPASNGRYPCVFGRGAKSGFVGFAMNADCLESHDCSTFKQGFETMQWEATAFHHCIRNTNAGEEGQLDKDHKPMAGFSPTLVARPAAKACEYQLLFSNLPIVTVLHLPPTLHHSSLCEDWDAPDTRLACHKPPP